MRNPDLIQTGGGRPGDMEVYSNITLRDIAAIAAMQGILANPTIREVDRSVSGAVAVAVSALECADALLAELEKPTKETPCA